MAAGVNYNVDPASTPYVTMNLFDNDSVPPPTPIVTIEDVNDAAEGGMPGEFVFTRTGETSQALTVNFAIDDTAAGAATFGVDYADPGTTVTFLAGSSTASVFINAVDDAETEDSETVSLLVMSGAGYDVGSPSLAMIDLLDNDPVSPPPPLPEITVTPRSDASEDGLVGRFRLTRTGDVSQPLTVAYQLSGDAIQGVDYKPRTGTVTFDAGYSTARVRIKAIDDSEIEPTESVVLTLLPGITYNFGATYSGTVNLLDNDGGHGTGQIGGNVWQDEQFDKPNAAGNGDGIRQNAEPTLPNVQVELLDENGTLINTTTTDAMGAYLFTNVQIGTYSVRVAVAAGMIPALQDQGMNDKKDSDVDPISGLAGPITLTVQKPDSLFITAGLLKAPVLFLQSLTRPQECLLAVVHCGIDNLTEAEFNKLRANVTIDDQVNPDIMVPDIVDGFAALAKADTLNKAQALAGGVIAGISLKTADAITLAPVLTGTEGIQILGKWNGRLMGRFEDAFDNQGKIKSVNDFALLGHELQHAVQIIRDGSNDGNKFLKSYLDDYAGQYTLRLADEIRANGANADLKKVQQLAYHGIMNEIEAYTLQQAIQNVFQIKANQTKFDKVCANVYDPKVGLKSLAGNKDVVDLQAALIKEYTTLLPVNIKANRR
ncbi:MAG: SdrD B-like domain-containing protein [Gemmataceae bacterium]